MSHQLMLIYNEAHRRTCIPPNHARTRTSVHTGLGVEQCPGMGNLLQMEVTTQQQERLSYCAAHRDVL